MERPSIDAVETTNSHRSDQAPRLLYITSPRRPGAWLTAALAADAAAEGRFVEACGWNEGLARLREQPYDAVLLVHEPPRLDGARLTAALRSGGSEEAILVLGEAAEHEAAPPCYEAGADAYLCIGSAATRTLLWTIDRAVGHRRLKRENERLRAAQGQRIRAEHLELERMLERGRRQLDRLVSEVSAERGNDDAAEATPGSWGERYTELLRANLMTPSNALDDQAAALARSAARAEATAVDVLSVHLYSVDVALAGLGDRSARRILMQADSLLAQVLLHLCEAYRLADAQESPARRDP